MKALIIYYSQTGNTMKIAQAITRGMRGAGCEVKRIKLNDAKPEMLDEYDVIGIGSPIWYADPPNLRRFINSLPQQNGKLLFEFCTHGTLPDLYHPIVIDKYARKGFRVIGWRDWYGNCTIQMFPSPYYTSGHPDEIDCDEAEAFGAEMSDKAAKILKGDLSLLPELPMPNVKPMHGSHVIDLLLDETNPHGIMYRDKSKCLYPKCTICQDNCTMGYIDLAKDRFGKQGGYCQDIHGCTYCELICPAGAIYSSPPFDVDTEEEQIRHKLFTTILSMAEKQGVFRRLIPFEKVGLDTPFYKTHPKHPRIKVPKDEE